MKTLAQTLALLAVSFSSQIACQGSLFSRADQTSRAKGVKPAVSQTPAPVKTPAIKNSDTVVAPNLPVSDSAVLSQISEDLNAVNPAQVTRLRYFSLQVANNVGASAEVLDTQRKAFKKVLNSLSTQTTIVTPVAIDATKLIYRVDLDDIGMSPAEFDQVIADHYPFNNRFADIGTTESISSGVNDDLIRRRLLSDIGVIRMDWFNATATLPILYKKFMRFPNTLAAFEDEFLGDDRLDNIISDDVIRIGFDGSITAQSNRVLELHDGKNGGFYVSYDFLQAKQGQIFAAPLGPRGANARDRALEFQEDQRSIIFTLPNGLLGFYMADAQGTAQDKAPINILRNIDGPPEFSLALTNGQSCMSCHNAGLLFHEDSILSGIATNKQLFGSADLARINRIYQPSVFKQEVAKDNARYFAAMKTMGISPTSPDPVDAAYRFYTRPMKIKDVLKESGLTDQDFTRALVDPEFSGTFNALNNPEGTVTRAVFQSVYPNLIRKFKQDLQRTAPRQADFLVTADCMTDDAVRMDTCIISQ